MATNVPSTTTPEATQPQAGHRARPRHSDLALLASKFHSSGWRKDARIAQLVFPLIMHGSFHWFSGFLSCPKCVLVGGNCCERLREIFVRVLHSSRVNLIMQIIQTCSVVSKTKSFYLFLLHSSILSYKSSIGNKVQFLVCCKRLS